MPSMPRAGAGVCHKRILGCRRRMPCALCSGMVPDGPWWCGRRRSTRLDGLEMLPNVENSVALLAQWQCRLQLAICKFAIPFANRADRPPSPRAVLTSMKSVVHGPWSPSGRPPGRAGYHAVHSPPSKRWRHWSPRQSAESTPKETEPANP